MTRGLSITPLTERDIPLLLALVRELAEYEKLLHEVEASEEDLKEHLLGPNASAQAVLARLQGQAVGYAIVFYNYSTFTGRKGLYLEDIFIKPECRGQGVGRALFRHCVGLAHRAGCARMDWAVLEWNINSQEFYRSLGAKRLDGWHLYRLDRQAIERLAPSEKADDTQG